MISLRSVFCNGCRLGRCSGQICQLSAFLTANGQLKRFFTLFEGCLHLATTLLSCGSYHSIYSTYLSRYSASSILGSAVQFRVMEAPMGNVLFSGLEDMSTTGLTGLERLNNDKRKCIMHNLFVYEKDYQ